MTLDFTYHEGSQSTRPAELDVDSSKVTVYLRRNIRQITREDEGVFVTLWAYEEAKLTREEYIKYTAENLVPALNVSQKEQDDIIAELLEII